MTLTFPQARDFKMPLGQHAGKTLDQIATSDAGLLYLDWLRGERKRKSEPLDEALTVYLEDPTIAKEIGAALKSSSRRLPVQRGGGREWRSRDSAD